MYVSYVLYPMREVYVTTCSKVSRGQVGRSTEKRGQAESHRGNAGGITHMRYHSVSESVEHKRDAFSAIKNCGYSTAFS